MEFKQMENTKKYWRKTKHKCYVKYARKKKLP